MNQFLNYHDQNPDLNIVAFGLNCAEPEDMLASFESIFCSSDRNIAEEIKSRQLGICAYCNLNDRRKVHSSGFDRSKDKHQVCKPQLSFLVIFCKNIAK